jgi:hypothetical protein
VDDEPIFVTWVKDGIYVGYIGNDCELGKGTDTTYNYICDLDTKMFYLIIPPDAITDGIQNVVWRCFPPIGLGSNTWSLKLSGTYGE